MNHQNLSTNKDIHHDDNEPNQQYFIGISHWTRVWRYLTRFMAIDGARFEVLQVDVLLPLVIEVVQDI